MFDLAMPRLSLWLAQVNVRVFLLRATLWERTELGRKELGGRRDLRDSTIRASLCSWAVIVP
jgi:hypothetical protein